MKLLVEVKGELIIIQIIHNEFDVETNRRTGLKKVAFTLLVNCFFYMRKIMFSVKGMKHYTFFVGCDNVINLVLAVLFSHS